MDRRLLRDDRLRTIERPFGWIPLRLLSDPHWVVLSPQAKLLYCVLCIVGDRRGISFYADARLQQLTGLHATELAQARAELVTHDLMALDPSSSAVQLLSLPATERGRSDSRQPASSHVSAQRAQPTWPSRCSEQQLQAVRQLISTLTADTRLPRSQTHDAQK